MVWGITSIRVPPVRSIDDLVQTGEEELITRGHVRRGEEIVIVTGDTPMRQASHMMKIARAGD
jgi:pyruvate kinase